MKNIWKKKWPSVSSEDRELYTRFSDTKSSVVWQGQFLWSGRHRRQTRMCWKVNNSLYAIFLSSPPPLCIPQWIRSAGEEKHFRQFFQVFCKDNKSTEKLCVSRRAFLCVSLAHLVHIKNPDKVNCFITRCSYCFSDKSSWLNPPKVYFI